MKTSFLSACAAAMLAVASAAAGQAGAPAGVPAAAVSPPVAQGCCRLPAGTVVSIELAELVSTRTAKPGDHFAIRTAEPMIVDGKTIVPAGAVGLGEVIDTAAGGLGGRPAKLILAARYVDYGNVRIRLHAFHLGGAGHDNGNLAMAASFAPYVGLLAFTIPGGNLAFPAGTRANAKLTDDLSLPEAARATAPNPTTSGTAP